MTGAPGGPDDRPASDAPGDGGTAGRDAGAPGADDRPGSSGRPAGGRRVPTVAVVAAAVVALDQATKHWAVNALSGGRTVDVLWTLRFKLHFNSGLSFSMAEGRGGLFALGGLLLLVIVVRSLLRWPGRLPVAVSGLVVGGALGNVVDRLLRAGGEGFMTGHVVDFIDLQWWPVFNVADMALTVGLVLMLLSTLLQRDRDEPERGGAPASAAPDPLGGRAAP